MSELIRRMEKKRTALAVTQHKYNQLRGRIPDAEIAIVEGSHDSIFYSSIFKRIGNTSTEIFFIANGNDNVLELRNLILNSEDIPRGGGVVFLVDHDFDGMKSSSCGNDLYVTPTYSIENILVCRMAFKNILLAEFKLGDADSIQDLEQALALFDAFLAQHAIALEEANELIHCVRKEALKGNVLTSGTISDQLKKFADLEPETLAVRKIATGNALNELITITAPIPSETLETHKADFTSILSNTNWRGKFLFFLFRRFLSALAEDKNRDNPKYFSKGRGKISIDTAADSLIRVLASGCNIPDCLRRFATHIPTQKLI